MWATILRIAVSALGGWVISDWWNTKKNIELSTGSTAPVGTTTTTTVKLNWVKWVVIGVGSAVIILLIAKIIKIVSPKTDILK